MVSYVWGEVPASPTSGRLRRWLRRWSPATIHTREAGPGLAAVQGYEPTTLRLGPLTRLGGRVVCQHRV